MRLGVAVCLLVALLTLLTVKAGHAQTATPDTSVFETLAPETTATLMGQTVRFDYVVTSVDVQIATALSALIYSVWGIFFFVIFWLIRDRRR